MRMDSGKTLNGDSYWTAHVHQI